MFRLAKSSIKASNPVEETSKPKTHRHTRTSSAFPRNLESFADEYRKLAIDCLKVLRVEMQLETIFHMQVCAICIVCQYLPQLEESLVYQFI